MSNIKRKVRVPFLPLTYKKEYIGEPMELMIDYELGRAYVKDLDGVNNIEIMSNTIVNEVVNKEIEKILDGVETDGNTLNKIRELIRPVYDWMDEMTKSDSDNMVNTLKEIINKFKDMTSDEQTLVIQLSKKVDKVDGKGLSSNDFTNALLDKINNIEEEANNYKHPLEKQCNYEAPVLSVNEKTGAVKLTKADIEGLEYVEEGANNYKHPVSKQCGYNFKVVSVNGMSGDITITKSDVGLENVENYRIATESEAIAGISNSLYLTPNLCDKIIEEYENGNIPDPTLERYDVIISASPGTGHTIHVTGNGYTGTGRTHEGLKIGTYEATVSLNGYKTKTQSFIVDNNEVVNITLEKETLDINYVPVSTAQYSALFALSDGTVKRSGTKPYGYIGEDKPGSEWMIDLPISNVKQTVCTLSNDVFLLSDGTVKGTRGNQYGQLGLGHTTSPINDIVDVPISGVVQIAGSPGSILYLMNDGTVKASGRNNYNKLGISDTSDQHTIVDVPISGVKSIICGSSYTMFLMNDGTVKGVGRNSNGQLGIGNTKDQSTIVDIPITNVKSISCGISHTMFLTNDGTVKGTGNNVSGQLGIGNTTSTSNIIDILSNAKFVSCGSHFTIFLLQNGAVKGCGSNNNMQLGKYKSWNEDGHINPDLLDISIYDVKSIVSGYGFSIYIHNDNTLSGIGRNEYGQLIIDTGMDTYKSVNIPFTL